MAASARTPRPAGPIRGILGCALLTLLGACAPAAAPPTPPRPNLLLITIDTLRADHLGAYGYELPTSVAIDALAQRGTVFERAQSSSSWTLPSLATLMTSTYTSTHGCWTFFTKLDDGFSTLAERLAGEGYATGGVASHTYVASTYGLNQGFEHYDEELAPTKSADAHLVVTSARVTDKGLTWIDERTQRAPEATDAEQPWFLWVHYFDPHYIYNEHAGITELFGDEGQEGDEGARVRYDGEIAHTDAQVGRLLDGLRKRGLQDDTVVVLTSDHGEEFRDHGSKHHGRTLYREVLRVPLIMAGPGIATGRVATPVGLVDVLPTLLDVLDIEPSGDLSGRSLRRALQGEALASAPLLAELRLFDGYHADAVLDGRWKLLVNPENDYVRLFDLDTDPGETTNVAASEASRVRKMIAGLAAMKKAATEAAPELLAEGDMELDEEELDTLRQLGYVDDR